MRAPTSFELVETHALDLPAIDLTASECGDGFAGIDRQMFEARYAELGFGLGTVARRQHRDDPWWETPAGMLVGVGGILLALALSITG